MSPDLDPSGVSRVPDAAGRGRDPVAPLSATIVVTVTVTVTMAGAEGVVGRVLAGAWGQVGQVVGATAVARVPETHPCFAAGPSSRG